MTTNEIIRAIDALARIIEATGSGGEDRGFVLVLGTELVRRVKAGQLKAAKYDYDKANWNAEPDGAEYT